MFINHCACKMQVLCRVGEIETMSRSRDRLESYVT